ncbi:uncharacterized protein RCC_10368 [Ramularia collo-cygni]|uniref:DUF7598 domain-containing protein n=1 Tax=Ramularia collo-cygni TaxID=112498 RepID=A0A2D3V9E4_9PEZI|nr:uncharacterized protein RCC_10368 [Ramularia collo-cygni]CZT24643.1 uncharacterized protein RCC_10368 [Ramularia collo-cygni]
MPMSSKNLNGPGYIILNGIRGMNIVALLAVITASIVMLVKISTDTKLFFFDAVSHVVTAITSMFLVTSELSLFRAYFARNWPLLSPSHGFVGLGLAMIVLGVNVMGNLNKPSGTQKELGLPFWRIVIGSGIIVFILGWINLIASYVFRNREQGTTARQVRAKGASVQKTPIVSSTTGYNSPPAPYLAQSYRSNSSSSSPVKSHNPFSSRSSERRDSWLPSYNIAAATAAVSRDSSVYKQDRPGSPTSRYSRATACTKKKFFGAGGILGRQSLAPPLPDNPQQQEREMEISAPMGVNPQFAHLVQRPDSALHPARSGESQAYRWRV